MAYVTRCRHDIFLSYAHSDDPTWISGFERGLWQELREKLGHEPTIWQDEHQIRLGQNWEDTIHEGIRGAAVFLAILSPGYQVSEWCGRERKCFLDQFAKLDDMLVQLKAGQSYRFLKIIKMPWEDDGHLEFFSQAQHLEFFERDASGVDHELTPGTAQFRTRIEEAAHHSAAILKAMRRMGEAVFVASPADDVYGAYEDLRNELRAQGYVVRPEGPLDHLYSDKAVKKEIASTLLSVHLLGKKYDEFVERQIRLAVELGKKLLFWIPKTALESAEPRQKKLLESLRNAEGIDTSFALIEDPAVRTMIGEVLRALKPAIGAKLGKSGEAPGVYLICDPSVAEDYDFAAELRNTIQARESLRVLLPEANTGGKSIEAAHHERMMESDGVLLYCNRAPLGWLLQQAPGVQWAEQILKRPAFRSKAFLLNDPSLLPPVFSNVITRPVQFDVNILEPFLAPLRQATAHANI